jgi:hypothetical protein
MRGKQADCPGCGAPLIFEVSSSMVVVCRNCNSVVARTDLDVEEIGKTAALSDTASALRLGLRGVWQGKSFIITGHAQMKHIAGGIWDEWYVALSNNTWGWLAEAQGKFYMTFQRELQVAPDFESLNPGSVVPRLPVSGALVVSEKASAEIAAVEGELPFRPPLKSSYRYADLTGANGEFATLDYRDGTPVLYLGREIKLSELGIDKRDQQGISPRRVQATKVNCPNCGGSLELLAPDTTLRVVCQYCNSSLDANKGALKYLETLKPKYAPRIPIGRRAVFDGVELVVMGFLKRSVILEGERWQWDEYLLYHPDAGYRWITFSDDEWRFVTPVPAGEVTEKQNGAQYGGRFYYRTQSATASVDYVLGEFYWKISVGDKVGTIDHSNGSLSLSKESSDGEVNWSHGRLIPRSEMSSKFGISTSAFSGTSSGELSPLVVAIIILVVIAVIVVIAINSDGTGGSYGGGSRGGYGGGFGGGK